jgi:hypothetical protein
MNENQKNKSRVLFKSVWTCEGKRKMSYYPTIIGVNI